MNFADFQNLRAELRRTRPALRDCAETNLYRALAHLAAAAPLPPGAPVHRCHLAAAWTDLFGLPPEWARRALVSRGVRDSLARLFQNFAGQQARIWLPEDNYPVFGELAQAAGLRSETFPTLGNLRLPHAPPVAGAEVLLLTHPLKPAGRWLRPDEVAELRRWLAAGPRRRLLLDAVYTFGPRFHPATLELIGTGQTLLLHSFTKGWLVPQLFGVALVPEADFAALAPAFRVNAPVQASLAQARELMERHVSLPAKVALELSKAEGNLRAALPFPLPNPPDAPARYLFPIALPWDELLSRHEVLGLPARTFGAKHDDLTILSSLDLIS